MASAINVSSSSALREQLYRPGLTHQAELQTFAMSFVDKAKDSVIVLNEEFSKKRGDQIQIRFSPTDDTRDGYVVGDTIQGTESDVEALVHTMKINWLGEAFRVDDPMSQQRVSWDQKQACFIKARTWWSRRWEQSIFNQLAGVTHAMGASGTNYKRTGMNPVIAVDSDHIFRPNAAANDDALGTNEKMSLDWINELILRATSDVALDYPLLPAPDGYYHLVIHPLSWRDLRQNTSPGDFQDLQRARLEGGQSYDGSAFAKGYVGLYNMTKIHVSNWIPLGQDHTDATLSIADVRRCVLLGANAGQIGFGQGYAGEGNHLDWTERIFEYKKWGVLADSIFGFNRTVVYDPDTEDPEDGQTWGCMVMPVYASLT